MKSFGAVLGSNATGKGTRMNQLIHFLKTKYNPELYFTIGKNNKKFNLGILFKDIDLLIVGKYVDTDFQSFTSLDSVWNKLGGTEETVSLFKTLDYNILCEGYSNTDTFRIRPVHMSTSGCNRFFYQIYSYGVENHDTYLKRIFERSGKHPKKAAGFEKETQILKYSSKINNELKEHNLDGVCYNLNYDEPITKIGVEYLRFLGRTNLVEEFIEYSNLNTHFKSFKENTTSLVSELF